MNIVPHETFKGLYWLEEEDSKLVTVNLIPGYKSCNEELITLSEVEYRVWSPYNSKIGAALTKGLKTLPCFTGSKILYLGIASGTTASYLSDIIGSEGLIYGVDFSARTLRDLLPVAEKRRNILPILGDARKPEQYASVVEIVDMIYCDVAQPKQARLLLDNAKMFLKEKGQSLLAIKARSIDVTASPEKVFDYERKELTSNGFTILQSLRLDPFQKDHMMVHGFFT
jgi:fibrillarin-like pre-rRNA processing protein